MKQVRIFNDSGVGHKTQIFDKDNNEITDLISVRQIVLKVDSINVALCELVAVSVDVLAEMQLTARHTGKKVTQIFFEDGEVWDLVGTGRK